jgi:hypothetical protein
MIGRLDISGKRPATAARLLSVFFVAVVAALFVLSFGITAFAAGGMQGDRGSFKGEIVAINHLHNSNTLTLQSSQIGQYPNDTMNIFVNRDTKVKVCSASEPFKDMKVDHSAAVTYHELGGLAVADSISEQC